MHHAITAFAHNIETLLKRVNDLETALNATNNELKTMIELNAWERDVQELKSALRTEKSKNMKYQGIVNSFISIRYDQFFQYSYSYLREKFYIF